jgi:microcystin-dependent protein
MSEPFMGEMRFFAFNFAPKYWATCSGQFLPINQNQALFSLLGTMYGGNGQTNFALPNLVGRTPVHVGNGWSEGQVGGEQAHTLTQPEMPAHLHQLVANDAEPAVTDAHKPGPAKRLSNSNPGQVYGAPSALAPMAGNAISSVGGSQAHDNMMPYTVVGFCIALQGIFPSRN